jgi:peptidoglycan/LPS O-acetylase OafA/YrhL
MKSTTGQHWIALDHVRALAAFMVFSWHFLHWTDGRPIPFSGAPAFFPLAVFDEGHVGVALFMTLSGYLFAKILSGRRMKFGGFLWNRFLRLAPLLLVTIIIVGVQQTRGGGDPRQYIRSMLTGFILPVWPNGGWSIAVELQFYLILPLLIAFRKRPWLFAGIIVAALAIRTGWWLRTGESKAIAYFTIFGRIDQFVAGIAAFGLSHHFKQRHITAVVVSIGFCAFYWLFDLMGGADATAQSWIWIFLPTIEGACFAVLIAYYDTSYSPSTTGLSWLIGKLGEYSYSIYLLHFFVLERLVRLEGHLPLLANFYVALACAVVAYVAMMPIGYLSYRFIEAPPLRFRKRYTGPTARHEAATVDEEAREAL